MPIEISNWIAENFNIGVEFQTKILYSLIVILLILFLRWVANKILARRIEDSNTLFMGRKWIGYLALALGILFVGSIWLRDAGSLATYLGLVSAALVIALQDPIANIVGWVFIMGRRPFVIGDRIEIGDSAGDVIDIRFFQFTLMEIGNWVDADQSTGRVLHIPNNDVFKNPIANYSKGFAFLWDEIAVVVTFESDWRRGKELLLDIAERRSAHLSKSARQRLQKAARRYMIHYDKLTPIVYTKVVDHGVCLTIRYLTGPRRRRGSQEEIWEEILDIFAAEPKLDFAYPTQRLYHNPTESHPALRPNFQNADAQPKESDPV